MIVICALVLIQINGVVFLVLRLTLLEKIYLYCNLVYIVIVV